MENLHREGSSSEVVNTEYNVVEWRLLQPEDNLKTERALDLSGMHSGLISHTLLLKVMGG